MAEGVTESRTKRRALKGYWARRARGAQMLTPEDFLAEVLGILREGFLTT